VTSGRSPLERRLDNLREVLGQEAVEDALKFMPNSEVEELAAREERERVQADRTAEAMTMRETRDAVLASRYGKDAKQKLEYEIHLKGNAEDPVVLHVAARLAAAERKAEYYRRLNGEMKSIK
jgi:hypothetical protein